MSFSIGEEIKKKVKERGMTNVAFAEKMSMDERNLYHFFKKKEISLDQLVEASYILDYDFIKLYLKNSKKKDKLPSQYFREPSVEYEETKRIRQQISFSVKFFGELNTIQKEMPELLATLQREAESRGLQLG